LAVVNQTTDRELVSGEISVETPTSEMATPPIRKKDKKDSSSTAMEL
jgi:hypothetical protein